MADEEIFEVEVETITLPLEDGTDQEFVILDEFEAEGNKYIVVATIAEDDTIGEDNYIYGYREDGDDIIIDYIEDDDEYDRVAEAYAKICEEDDEDDDEE